MTGPTQTKLRETLWYNFQDGINAEDVDQAIQEIMQAFEEREVEVRIDELKLAGQNLAFADANYAVRRIAELRQQLKPRLDRQEGE